MPTKRQSEFANSYLSALGDDLRPLYRELMDILAEAGYYGYKQGSSITFKHNLHNKQMAKMGVKGSKKTRPFFALRFSACREYSPRFRDIVSAYMERYPARAARCVGGGCTYCAGEPETHVYTRVLEGGERQTHCGAYALEIPDLAAEDLDELRRLIWEEHAYLMKHQVGVAEE